MCVSSSVRINLYMFILKNIKKVFNSEKRAFYFWGVILLLLDLSKEKIPRPIYWLLKGIQVRDCFHLLSGE